MPAPLPYRKVHLDFHTHPSVTGIGSRFGPERFADALANAGLDGVVLFVKDHYRRSFYRSPAFPVHPHLRVDFLPRAAAACLARAARGSGLLGRPTLRL